MNTLYTYKNGNYIVNIYLDGTKTRTCDTNDRLIPELPESIDLKITDYCDAGCPFCHEKSTKKGQHASISDILKIVDGLNPGTEIAIGGGNPLSHPELVNILQEFQSRGLISNITVHKEHAYINSEQIYALQTRGLIYGIGISVDREMMLSPWTIVGNPEPHNIVYHLIVGVSDPQYLIKSSDDRVLVLGYKKFGFGLKFYDPKVEANIRKWKYWISTIMKKHRSISFDNLALEQLGIKDRITAQAWAERFMGADGEFTMYVDAVKNEYAISSTSERKSINGRNIKQMFQGLR